MSEYDSDVSARERREGSREIALMLEGPPFGLEKIYDYEAGGHHPIHLNNVLNDRYKVIHKLGSGGSANVWLCKDITTEITQYVAVKIILAAYSNENFEEFLVYKASEHSLPEKTLLTPHFCYPLDKFKITGPNGLHFVLVYPVLGPPLSRLLNHKKVGDLGRVLRRMSFQVTEAMAAFHALGSMHSDFRPANILAYIPRLDGISEEEVLKALGTPCTNKVVTTSGHAHNEPAAPQYLVYPVDWEIFESSTLGADFIPETACVIDLGSSFNLTNTPVDIGIPQSYCSPEYILDRDVWIGSDVWALGCTLFEIRTGRKLFDTFDDDQDEYLCKVAMVLGKLPQPWWSEKWEARRQFLEDDADEAGRVVEVRRNTIQKRLEDIADDKLRVSSVPSFQMKEPRSLKEALAEGLFYRNKRSPGGFQQDISTEEIDLFSDLLAKILKYDPDERLTPKDALSHPWFKM